MGLEKPYKTSFSVCLQQTPTLWMVLPLSLSGNVRFSPEGRSHSRQNKETQISPDFLSFSPRQDFNPFLYPVHHTERQKHSKHANLENTSMSFMLFKSVLHFPSCLWHCSQCRYAYWKIWQRFCSVLLYSYFIFKHRTFLLIFPFLFIWERSPLPFVLRRLSFPKAVDWAVFTIAPQFSSCKMQFFFDRSFLKMDPIFHIRKISYSFCYPVLR